MDWTSIASALISAASAVAVALIAKRIGKNNEAELKRAERRKKESILSLQMISATMELALVEAEALTHGHLNGNVEAAKQKAKEAHDAYAKFEQEVLAEELSQ